MLMNNRLKDNKYPGFLFDDTTARREIFFLSIGAFLHFGNMIRAFRTSGGSDARLCAAGKPPQNALTTHSLLCPTPRAASFSPFRPSRKPRTCLSLGALTWWSSSPPPEPYRMLQESVVPSVYLALRSRLQCCVQDALFHTHAHAHNFSSKRPHEF